jgi:hypothetical protein
VGIDVYLLQELRGDEEGSFRGGAGVMDGIEAGVVGGLGVALEAVEDEDGAGHLGLWLGEIDRFAIEREKCGEEQIALARVEWDSMVGDNFRGFVLSAGNDRKRGEGEEERE